MQLFLFLNTLTLVFLNVDYDVFLPLTHGRRVTATHRLRGSRGCESCEPG